MNEEKKIDILIQALSQRYSAIETIRERVQSVCIWTLGLFLTAAGWLIQSDHLFTRGEKGLFTGMILICIATVRLYYLADLEKGFKTQQMIQARIETELGLCEDGKLTEKAIYPDAFLHAGTKRGKGNFFSHNYLLIYVGAAFYLSPSGCCDPVLV